MRSPALITACSKAGCYAVLASLSGRYPPLEGRSPTCYSPVRHSVIHCWITAFDLHVLGTPPALILSQDQTLMLNALFTAVAPCGAPTDRNCLTRSPVDLALALFSYFVFGEWSIRLATNSHPLTLDGRPPSRLATRRQTGPTRRLSSSPLSGPALKRSVRPLSLCLHALSSFQRTEYSSPAGAPTDRPFPSVLGEPSEVTIQNQLCQAPCSSNDGFGSG